MADSLGARDASFTTLPRTAGVSPALLSGFDAPLLVAATLRRRLLLSLATP